MQTNKRGVYISNNLGSSFNWNKVPRTKQQSISRITTHHSAFPHSNILPCYYTNNFKTWLSNCHYLPCFWGTWLRDTPLDPCCPILVVVCDHQCGSIISSLIVPLPQENL
ncbi:uncharacterized protein DS421_1g03930 [Arachis hypogaea]|nr:uncharacterized protein DS421_1g03930 [Arachis hypogaea]